MDIFSESLRDFSYEFYPNNEKFNHSLWSFYWDSREDESQYTKELSKKLSEIVDVSDPDTAVSIFTDYIYSFDNVFYFDQHFYIGFFVEAQQKIDHEQWSNFIKDIGPNLNGIKPEYYLLFETTQ